jgi:anti-anti-sigma factor
VSSSGESTGDFTVSSNFVGDEAVLTLRGELDLGALPGLSSVIDAVIASGYLKIMVDMADVVFVASSGLTVIAHAASRVAALRGRLTIRSPSTTVRRVLDIGGLQGLTSPVTAPVEPAQLGPFHSMQQDGAPAVPDPLFTDAGRTTAVAIPIDDDAVDGTLRLVVALARATVSSADGASVSLRRHGYLATVAATDQTIVDMDTDQYETRQGPCVDAATEGRWFHAESLEAETRWPAFIPRARSLGINAILSTPLLAQDRPVGALNIYSRTVRAFSPEDQKLAGVFATQASIVLTDAGMNPTTILQSTRYQEALGARRTIAQAQGVLMARTGISPDEAYDLLRVHSLRTSQPLLQRASDVVHSTRWFPSDPRPPNQDGLSG